MLCLCYKINECNKLQEKVNQMRYLGSKVKLLSAIEEVIRRYHIQGETFADLFAGTGCVGDHFKDRYKILSNDFLYYSYVMNRARLENEKIPDFDQFQKRYRRDIFQWLNQLEFQPDESYFIYHNYTPKAGRMFFTEENGIRLDGIRLKIEELYRDEVISEREYFFLLASMMESMTKISNTSGTYEAYFKFWDSRAEKEFEIQPLEMCESRLHGQNEIYNMDTNRLVRNIGGDIAYIDPPYTVTQYVSAYHMFETLTKYDCPNIKGVGGKRSRGDKNSLYAQRANARMSFEDLFRQINFKHVLVSYSNQGLVPLEELCQLAKKFAVNGVVHVEYFDYREYQNHRSSNKSNGNKLNEVILYFEKDMSLHKSPLNYSGSKDMLLPKILTELPPHVGTFVDAMGGAFNVGANVLAMDRVVYNELNPFVYEIMRWLIDTDRQEIIERVEGIIREYQLEKADKEKYIRLREAYNAAPDVAMLYVLHMYSFQNMLRFNGDHKFNTPVGVAGYSEDIKNRILTFKSRTERIELLNEDYTSLAWESYPEDTVFYFDPPYFITSAAYNDGKRGMKGWGSEEEAELLKILTMLDTKGYRFILSNVLKHKDKTHNLLTKWISEHNYQVIEAGTSGWRYAKDEVLIKNF